MAARSNEAGLRLGGFRARALFVGQFSHCFGELEEYFAVDLPRPRPVAARRRARRPVADDEAACRAVRSSKHHGTVLKTSGFRLGFLF